MGRSCCFISSCSRSHWHSQEQKGETETAMSSDLTVSWHAATGRATCVKSFLISGWFMWHYFLLTLGLSHTQECSVFPLLWHSRWASHALTSSVFVVGCCTQIHQRFEEQTLSSDYWQPVCCWDALQGSHLSRIIMCVSQGCSGSRASHP